MINAYLNIIISKLNKILNLLHNNTMKTISKPAKASVLIVIVYQLMLMLKKKILFSITNMQHLH